MRGLARFVCRGGGKEAAVVWVGREGNRVGRVVAWLVCVYGVLEGRVDGDSGYCRSLTVSGVS